MLIDLTTGELRPVVPEAPRVSSAAGPWPGFLFEEHAAGGPLELIDVAPPEPVLVVQFGPPKDFEWKENGRFRPMQFLPMQTHIFPALAPFSLRTPRRGDVVSLVLEPRFLRCAAHDLFTGPDRIELRPRLPTSDPLLHALATSLKVEIEAGYPGGRAYGETLATALAAHLVHHYSNARPLTQSRSGGLTRRQMRRALDYLHDHLAEEVSLAALAGEVGLSPFHFARLFKHAVGLAPHQYLIHCRIERARVLLLTGRDTTADIAQQVGFCDQSHLTTHFKRLFGLTPKKFRQEMGGRKTLT